MKKRFVGVSVALLLVGSALNAGATIWENGFDTVADQYWQLDLSAFVDKTYEEQLESIAELNTQGGDSYGEWRMATAADILNLLDNYTIAEISSYFSSSSDHYWDGRYEVSPTQGSHSFLSLNDSDNDGFADLVNGSALSPNFGWTHLDTASYGGLSAWVVADHVESNSGVAPIPEPTTILLFGTGLAGLAGVRRKKK